VTAEEAELVFERFWRSDPSRAGSGLGLAIVRATAERHGGRAYVRGAQFTIELPSLTNLSRSPARTTA
jgi:signal transduction histidine kinase